MSEAEALQVAIETMRTDAYLAEIQARAWRVEGDELRFNKAESRIAAETADTLTEAAAVLESLRARLIRDVNQ